LEKKRQHVLWCTPIIPALGAGAGGQPGIHKENLSKAGAGRKGVRAGKKEREREEGGKGRGRKGEREGGRERLSRSSAVDTMPA
jgi:hypothetical protein